MADSLGMFHFKVLRFTQVLLLACALGNIQSRCVAQGFSVRATGALVPARFMGGVGTETAKTGGFGQTNTGAQRAEPRIQTLWQIGVFDQSSGEFTRHNNAAAYSD